MGKCCVGRRVRREAAGHWGWRHVYGQRRCGCRVVARSDVHTVPQAHEVLNGRVAGNHRIHHAARGGVNGQVDEVGVVVSQLKGTVVGEDKGILGEHTGLREGNSPTGQRRAAIRGTADGTVDSPSEHCGLLHQVMPSQGQANGSGLLGQRSQPLTDGLHRVEGTDVAHNCGQAELLLPRAHKPIAQRLAQSDELLVRGRVGGQEHKDLLPVLQGVLLHHLGRVLVHDVQQHAGEPGGGPTEVLVRSGPPQLLGTQRGQHQGVSHAVLGNAALHARREVTNEQSTLQQGGANRVLVPSAERKGARDTHKHKHTSTQTQRLQVTMRG